MMDCKAALGETNGDMTAAQDWLRKKGLSKAAKKAGRVAAEGLIGLKVQGTKGVVVEVNSETDFVARNDLFQGLVKMIADVALSVGTDVEKIKAAKAGSITHRRRDQRHHRQDRREHDAAPRRRARGRARARSAPTCTMRSPTASARSASSSRWNSSGKADELVALGRRSRCMSPRPIRRRSMPPSLDPAIVKREKDVLADKYRQQGKPENVIEKIVEFGPQDLLQGSLPARAAVHLRRQEDRRAGA